MFLQNVQSVMENFEDNPKSMGNVVTVNVVDTRFIMVSRISESEYIMSDIETDDNDIPHVIETIYAQDSVDEDQIISYIWRIYEEMKSLYLI